MSLKVFFHVVRSRITALTGSFFESFYLLCCLYSWYLLFYRGPHVYLECSVFYFVVLFYLWKHAVTDDLWFIVLVLQFFRLFVRLVNQLLRWDSWHWDIVDGLYLGRYFRLKLLLSNRIVSELLRHYLAFAIDISAILLFLFDPLMLWRHMNR